ncbi:MAG TPA: hypothetical protein VGE52_03045, partial [Pirellulales bacterium]
MKPDGANRENLNREDASENTPHSHRAVRRLVTLHAVLTAVLFVAFGACLNLIRHSLANELLAGLLVAAAATQAALLGAWLAFGVGVGKPQPRGLLKSAAAVIGVYVLGFFVMWNEPPPLWASLVVWLPIKLAVCTMGVCVLLAPPWFATVTVGFAAREYGWSWMDEQTPPGDEPQFSLRTLMLFLLVVTAFVFVAAITRGPRYSPYSPTSGDGAAFPVLYLMAFAAAPALAVVVSFGPRQRLAPC